MSKAIVLIAFLVGIIPCAYGSSLSLIAADDDRINGAKAVYLNQNVLFFGEQLSVYDTAVGQFKGVDFEFDTGQLEGTDNNIEFADILQLDNYVYFSVLIDQAYAGLWRTDGTVAGTQSVYAEFIDKLDHQNGFLLGANADNKLWVFNGNSFYLHDIDYDLVGYRCVFAIDHLVYTNIFLPITRLQQDTVTEFDIPMAWSINPFYPVFDQTSENCLVEASVFGDDPGRKLINIPRTGLVSILTELPELEAASHVFNFNDRVITETPGLLLRLNHDLQGIDASLEVDNNNTRTLNPMPQTGRSLFHYRSKVRADNSPLRTDTLIDFNRNQSIAFESTDESALHNTADAEHFFHYFAPSSGRLWLNVLKNNQSSVDFPDHRDVQVLSHPNQAQLYALLTDEQNQTSVFYQVVDDITISSLITGGWHDPNIKNQGLNIRQGLRHDGSDYVSVTGYTYRDGEPLWFAGDTNLALPQQTATVTLFEFDGIGLFEAGVTPNIDVFGQIEFQMTSCHTLSATITTEDEVFDLNLSRLDDVTFTQNCVD